MDNRKIYINRDDILTGSSDPNGAITSTFQGQMYVDSNYNYYVAKKAGTTEWNYLLSSKTEITFEQ